MKLKIFRLSLACIICITSLLIHTIINSKDISLQLENGDDILQTTFAKHEQKMQQNLSILLEKIKTPTNQPITYILDSIANNDNFSYYVFDKDELLTWNNAIVPINDITPNTLSNKILETANGWYFIKKHTHADISVFALFRIKSKYLYNNEYLNSSFDKSFGIDGHNKIIIDPQKDGYKIHDAQGEYLFSITNNSVERMTSNMFITDIIMLIIWLLSALIVIYEATTIISRNISSLYAALVLLLSLIGLYIWALNIDISIQMSSMFIFSAQVFAYAWWMPSLAFIFLASLCIIIFAYFLYNHINLSTIYNNQKIEAKFLASIIILFIIFTAINHCINSLIYHSTDLAIYVTSLDVSGPTLVKVSILTFLTLTLFFTFDCVYKHIANSLSISNFSIYLSIISILILLPLYFILEQFSIIFFIGFIIFNILFYIVRRRNQKVITFSTYIWLMFLSTLYIMTRLTDLNIEKEKNNRELLTDNLSIQLIREDDPVAESALLNIESKLHSDSIIITSLTRPNYNWDILDRYLRDNYFDGYLSRFDLQIIPCQGLNSKIKMTNSGEEYDCFDYFSDLIETFGTRISPNSNFYCLNDNDGRASYFGQITYDVQPNSPTNLYIELDSKPYSDGFGYPELLTNSRDRINMKQLKGYSYAKYYRGNISTSYGNYNFPPKDSWIGNVVQGEHKYVTNNGYSHSVFAVLPDQTIVLTYPTMTITQFATDYSFLFLIMLIISIITLYILGRRHNNYFQITSIQERIQAAFVILILALLTVFCFTIGLRAAQRFEQDSQKRMTQLLNAVKNMVAIEFSDSYNFNPNDIDNLLQRANTLFSIDAHIYSLEGKLIGTSRREFFNNGVTSQLINSKALIELQNNQSANEIFINERIGDLTYFSIYSRMTDFDGHVTGYINIPYFTDVNAMRNQLLSTFVPVTNSFLLIILLTILFSYFVARSITKPLLYLSNNIRKVGLQKNNEKIQYPNNDEIGLLVAEYNRMLDELAYSAEKLAASERELTWREMARQIAHEIKNPLTPMKLSVQYLIKAWDAKRDDFDTFIRKVANTLTEQIDQLSYIASQFSNLAKMQNNVPLAPVDIAERLANTILLFERSENAEITFSQKVSSAIVYANADQMTSVFNNLIKNAIQAAKPDETIKIHATIDIIDNKAHISISDNGHGIPPEIQEKIFKPNFTTKSTGMGLGLAIVKNIIVNSHGEIWFETQVERGTTFFIEIPIIEQNTEQ